ncbi:MAG TPA: universal stress protein [Chitinophagales bacterium]|nr:universal stress protein [Chitinophagales bacterium]
MYNYKRLLAGIDFTPTDKAVIRYLSFLCGIIHPEKIYFINFQRNLDVPEGIREKFPELNRPRDEKFREQMMTEVQANFPGHEKYDIEYDVIEGVPLPEMLRWAHIKNVDLAVAGKKPEKEGTGLLAQQMARKGTCSMLFVPPAAKARLQIIFAAVDFSENSKLALDEAWKLAEPNKEVKLVCYHAYSLPSGYYKTGKTEEEFAAIMRGHAENRCKNFISELKIPASRITPLFELEDKLPLARMIKEAAEKCKADIILVGAKGRTNVTAILLGSVTEKLIKLNSDIPLLVVKQKDKSFRFLDFIKNV